MTEKTLANPNQLSLVLRQGTSQEHDLAENAGFIRCFFQGVLEKESYALHLVSFYFVYSTLEEELRKNQSQPHVAPIFFPELDRKDCLERDLEFFYGKDWKQQLKISPATQAYMNRIQSISQENPTLLVAHSYVRYLGDLSGGQMLKKVAGRSLGLTGTEGLDFYEFPKIQNHGEFKNNYRKALDELPLDDNKKDEVLSEAKKVFELNQGIFQELESVLIKNIGLERYNEILSKPKRG